jgi:hypothetical protein
MTMTKGRPDHSEAKEYYWRYMDRIQDDDIVAALERNGRETAALLRSVGDEQSKHRYAEGKWSIREATLHVIDAERVFASRALWFARGFTTELPSFDQDIAVAASGADARSRSSLIEEFEATRASTIAMFRGLPEDAWMKSGVASGNPFTVRALAYMIAGHADYHNAILRERYLVSA